MSLKENDNHLHADSHKQEHEHSNHGHSHHGHHHHGGQVNDYLEAVNEYRKTFATKADVLNEEGIDYFTVSATPFLLL